MAMLLPPEVMTPRVECSTSGLTKSWACTVTTTSSAASPVSPSASQVAFYWRDTMTLTVMCGTPWELKEQVFWPGMTTVCPAWESPRMGWPCVQVAGTASWKYGTNRTGQWTIKKHENQGFNVQRWAQTNKILPLCRVGGGILSYKAQKTINHKHNEKSWSHKNMISYFEDKKGGSG